MHMYAMFYRRLRLFASHNILSIFTCGTNSYEVRCDDLSLFLTEIYALQSVDFLYYRFEQSFKQGDFL